MGSHNEVRLYASHPDFKKFEFMQNMLLIAINPQMFFGLEVDVAEAERLATVELIKEDIGKAIDEYVFLPTNIAEYINKLEENLQEGDK